VLGGLAVRVIVLNDLVHEGSEDLVAVVGASVYTDTGVSVFAAREDSLAEGEVVLVLLVLELVPQLLGKVLGEEGLGALGEDWEVYDIIGLDQLGAHGGGLAIVNFHGVGAVLACLTTHCFIRL
jgi:hypothetical protein